MNLLEKKVYVAALCILCRATAVVFCVCRYLIVFSTKNTGSGYSRHMSLFCETVGFTFS